MFSTESQPPLSSSLNSPSAPQKGPNSIHMCVTCLLKPFYWPLWSACHVLATDAWPSGLSTMPGSNPGHACTALDAPATILQSPPATLSFSHLKAFLLLSRSLDHSLYTPNLRLCWLTSAHFERFHLGSIISPGNLPYFLAPLFAFLSPARLG